jgi:predicted transposase YbfD/YdcC
LLKSAFYDVQHCIKREGAGEVEQETRANPEGRFADEVRRAFSLEQLKEIIDAKAHYQQAAERIRHRVKGTLLQEQNIGKRSNWK